MRTRLIVFCLFGFGSFIWMLYIAKNRQLGGYAHSPQTVVLPMGRSTLVAGGRAKLWFGSVEPGVYVEVSCKSESKLMNLQEGEAGDDGCGVHVRLLAFKRENAKATFEVSWKEE